MLQGRVRHSSPQETDAFLWRFLKLPTDFEPAISFQAARAVCQRPVDRVSVIERTSSGASVSLSQIPLDRDCASQGRYWPHRGD